MEPVNRGLVVGEIGRLILFEVGSRAELEKQIEENPGEIERMYREIEKSEERILTLMEVAHKLGVYEEATDEGTAIPQYLLEKYWGADHPRARRGGG